jgi:hypothetical protein
MVAEIKWYHVEEITGDIDEAMRRKFFAIDGRQ